MLMQRWISKGYELFTKDSIENFQFKEGQLWLSTNKQVTLACLLYFAVIFGLQGIMRCYKKPFKLTVLFRLHNLLLTVVSLGLLVALVENVAEMYSGLHNSICSASSFTPKLQFLYYLNYLTKYYELVDTVFLVLKKKKLQFLHVYHHSLTALLCYIQLKGKTSVSWVPIALNLAVHVVMYFYYYKSTFCTKVWFKKYVTKMQILQFVIDLVAIYYCTFLLVSHKYSIFPSLRNCAGSQGAALFGCYLLTSYLVLFILFFFKSYRTKKTTGQVEMVPKPKQA